MMEGRLMGVLDGKVAIVTGTSRGVGVGIAHELLRAGATVVGCSRSALDAIPGIEADWAVRASQQVCDQGDYRSIDSFVADVVATLRIRLDILFFPEEAIMLTGSLLLLYNRG